MEYSIKDILYFLLGTFGLSFIAFIVMYLVPEAQSPEGFPGLPVWFLAVWSPTITAILIAWKNGSLQNLLGKLIQFKGIWPGLIILLIPIGIICGVLLFTEKKPLWNELPVSLFFILIGFNLLLGPLGEELGWRGFLQPLLSRRFDWITASLIVGVIWSLWHGPLWFINSPQAEIPFMIFIIHVMSYSLMMGAAGILAPHSIVPAILLHLLFNVTSGIVLIIGVSDTASWYSRTALPYLICAISLTILVQMQLFPGTESV